MIWWLATGIIISLVGPVPADAEGNEQRLREELRRTITQLRQAEDENAVLRSQDAEAKAAADVQTAQIATLRQQLADSETTLKEVGRIRQQLDSQTARERSLQQRFSDTQALLDKWQSAYKQAAEVARARDAAAKHFYAVSWRTGANLKICVDRNQQLSKLGLEILGKYQDKGLVEAIRRDEPFTQFARVKLENDVQAYSEKIEDNELKIAPRNRSDLAVARGSVTP